MQKLGVLLLAVCLGAMNAPAQVLYGSLTGNVTDAADAAVPGAKVEAVNVATGVAKQGTTDERGVYLFNDLQPGSYKLTISSSAFRTVVQSGVAIDANNLRRIDARLQVASVTESIVVEGSAVSLQTDRADINAQISKTQVTNLPLGAGRNFQNLYKLIPGFTPPAELHSDAGNPQRAMGTNVNGASYSNNNTRIDGATVSYPWLPHIVAYVPPQDAIETVNVVTNSFDAEQGMAGGAAMNVTIKSGTNQLHGSLHEFHTNSAMRARNYFYYGGNLPKNILNQFGGTIGGAIKKNKLFFFADWERTVRRQNASAFRTLPNTALRAGDFSGFGTNIYDPATGAANGTERQLFPGQRIPSSRIDFAAAKMLGLLTQPNYVGLNPASNIIQNNHFASGTYEFNRDNADFKVNYNPIEKMSLFARYSFSPSLIFDPPSLGAAGGDALNGGQPGRAPGLIQSAAIGGTYTVSPRILIDGNVGFTRLRLSAENVDLGKNYGSDDLNIPGTNGGDRLQGGYPRFNISGFSALGNPNVSNPFLFRDNQYVAVGNVGWFRGAHSFRFGAEYAYYTINHFQPQAAFGPRGGFNFTGGLTALNGGAAPNLYNGFADFLLGQANGMGKDVQNINPAAVRMPSYGFYARDQWQVNRKLTLNYGMRYEYYPFATRDHRGGERYDASINRVLIGGLGSTPRDTGVDVGWGQIAPRLGIAYRATEKTVFRVGYGISIDPNSFRSMRDAYPATISTQFSGTTSFLAAGNLRTGIPAVVPPDVSSGSILLPAAVGTVTFPQVFNRGYIQSFNATIQRELMKNMTLQVAYVGTRAIRQTAPININASTGIGRGNADRALFPAFGLIGNINQLTPFNTSNYNAFQMQLTKRLSGTSQLGLAYTRSKAISWSDNSDSGLTWNTPSEWRRNRAVAGFDRPNNLQIFGIYELPFGKGQQYATGKLASAILGGWQLNGIFSAFSGTPFTVASAGASLNSQGNTQTADQVVATVDYPKQIGRGASYFDPLAFAPVTAVRYGNTGRNLLRGPGVINLDGSLFRNFNVTERFRLQFRAEVFNVSNTAAFNNPGATVSGATRNSSGQITALNGYTEITSAQATERQFRLALKILF
jgi:Carboxypeptidase regulatory-like domain/TonB dependent receptor